MKKNVDIADSTLRVTADIDALKHGSMRKDEPTESDCRPAQPGDPSLARPYRKPTTPRPAPSGTDRHGTATAVALRARSAGLRS